MNNKNHNSMASNIMGDNYAFNEYFGLSCKCCRKRKLSEVDHNQFLLLKEIKTEVQLRGLLATVQATLLYQNSSESPVEVEYRMPLQSTDVITELTAIFAGKQVNAVVKDKEKAKDDYDDAIASGVKAVYAEQDKSDKFTILLGNLPAGESAEVRLTLVQELQVTEEEAIQFILPTTLKPRYQLAAGTTPQAAPTPTTQALQHVAYTSNKYDFSFTMSAEFPGGFKKVESPSYHLSTEQKHNDLLLIRLLEAKTSLDFVVLLFPATLSIPIAFLEDPPPLLASSTEDDGTSNKKQQLHAFCTRKAFTINFIPSFPPDSDCPCELIFVIDRSGSMSGRPMQNAKQTLEIMLRSLEPGCYFNIVGFGTSYTFLYPKGSVEYTQKSLEHASKETQAMFANLGGTNIMEPLNAIYNTKKLEGLPRQILLLTDGSVSDTASVVQTVKNHVGDARVFGIGIGSGASNELVNGISEAGKGKAVFVSDGERMQSKILKLMSDAMSPCCTDVKLSYNASKMCIFPQNLPQIFSEERLIVYGFLLEEAADPSEHVVKLEYSQNKANYLHEVKLSSTEHGGDAEKSNSQLIHKLASRAALNEWEDASDTREECISLSCSMGVVCKLTAMIAIDDTVGSAVEGSLQLYDVTDNFIFRNINYIENRYAGNIIPPSGGRGGRGGRARRGNQRFLSESSDKKSNALKLSRETEKQESDLSLGFFGAEYETMEVQEEIRLDCLVHETSNLGSSLFETNSTSRSKARFPSDQARSKSEFEGPLKKSKHLLASSSGYDPTSDTSHESIVKLQSALGYWDTNSTPQLLKLHLLSNEQLNLCPVGIDTKLWITLLVMAIFEKRYATFKDEWFLVAKKARKWTLSCQLPKDITLEELTDTAKKVLG